MVSNAESNETLEYSFISGSLILMTELLLFCLTVPHLLLAPSLN